MSESQQKLSDEDIAEIRRLNELRRTLSHKSLAKRYGVGYEYIRKIACGEVRASKK